MTIKGGRDFFDQFLADFWQVAGGRWPNLRVWEGNIVWTPFCHRYMWNVWLLSRNLDPDLIEIKFGHFWLFFCKNGWIFRLVIGLQYEFRNNFMRCRIHDFCAEILTPAQKKQNLAIFGCLFAKMAEFLGWWSVYSTNFDTTSCNAEYMTFVQKFRPWLEKTKFGYFW